MKLRGGLVLAGALIMVTGLLLGPALAQGDLGEHFKHRKDALIKELNLSPEKAKELQAAEEKFTKERKALFGDLKKFQEELGKALAAPTPDDKKVKELVSAITATQDKMFATFKAQRDADLALMTPVQQARFLLGISKMRHEWAEKCRQIEAGEKEKKEKK